MRFISLALVSVFSLGFFSLLSCSNKSDNRNAPLRNVILTEADVMGATTSNIYPGVVGEGKSVNTAFMTGGKLLTTNVKVGDIVRKGQLLATLDATDYEIGVNQLQVQYDQMVAEKKRMDEMFARHNIAPNDYEKFVAGFEQLKLQLDMVKNKLGYTRLYSPSDGFISYQYMQPGELVDAGTSIYKIIDDSKLEVSVDLPLSLYLNRNDIKGAFGTVPNIPEPIPLKIETFTPDADNNQLYHMKLDIPSKFNKELTTGMNMAVTIEVRNGESDESLIPSRAIFDEKGIAYVWLFNENDSSLIKKAVTVKGQPIGDKNMVTGLSGNEKIVAVGVKQLKEGEKVNVVPQPLR